MRLRSLTCRVVTTKFVLLSRWNLVTPMGMFWMAVARPQYTRYKAIIQSYCIKAIIIQEILKLRTYGEAASHSELPDSKTISNLQKFIFWYLV